MHHHRLALAKKLLLRSSFFSAKQTASSPFPFPCRFRFISSEPPPFSHQTPNDSNTYTTHHPSPNTNTNTYTTDSSSSSTTPPPPPPRDRDRDRDRARPTTTTYEEEQARVLAASLHHVIRLGWSEAAMIAGARDVSVSPSIVGSIPRKEAALVEYFMDHCFQKLVDTIDSDSDDSHFKDLVPSDRIAYLIKLRLLMQAPYISKWPQALSIQAQPSNISTSFKQRAMLVDELCHASNDEEATGVDWYLKRSVVGGIYSSTEIYMLTDNSTDFDDTWAFLNERVRDAFDLKKTFQEVKYFAEAVGAGLGSSLQGFTKKG